MGAAKALSTEEAKEKLKEEANSANKAAKDIEDTYDSLQLKIGEIDDIHQSDFAPMLKEHRDVRIYTYQVPDRLLRLGELLMDYTEVS